MILIKFWVVTKIYTEILTSKLIILCTHNTNRKNDLSNSIPDRHFIGPNWTMFDFMYSFQGLRVKNQLKTHNIRTDIYSIRSNLIYLTYSRLSAISN